MNRSTDAIPAAAPGVALPAQTLVPGHARGFAIALPPLSFWGGYDAGRGTIVDGTHAGFGRSLAGRVLVMPRARGSSSSSSVLAEALRNRTGPNGIVLIERDLIVSIGAIVANELYALSVPVVVVDETVFEMIAKSTSLLEIEALDASLPATIHLASA
jgi:uncharacterized protein